MTWSTREVADLAGTSLRAVRHYHEIGLLAEPARCANGYKQYGVGHLVRLVRIKRLTDLGFSLPQIAAMGDADDHPAAALLALDTELSEAIERLQRVRAEVRTILDQSAPIDLPPSLAPPEGLSQPSRSLMVVLSLVLAPRGVRIYADLLAAIPSEFDDLAADADDAQRRGLAGRIAPHVMAAHPGLDTALRDAPRGGRFAQNVIDVALAQLYHPAQLDVMRRARLFVRQTSARKAG